MNQGYNFYNLEASFKSYLVAGNKSVTVKNYLSDFRHFLGWAVIKFKVQNSSSINSGLKLKVENQQTFIQLLTPNFINEYKTYLIDNKIPLKTINRRLSTVRRFCSFCISQGWLKENPAKKIANYKYESEKIDNAQLVNQYKDYLNNLNLDNQTINDHISDIDEFLSI